MFFCTSVTRWVLTSRSVPAPEAYCLAAASLCLLCLSPLLFAFFIWVAYVCYSIFYARIPQNLSNKICTPFHHASVGLYWVKHTLAHPNIELEISSEDLVCHALRGQSRRLRFHSSRAWMPPDTASDTAAVALSDAHKEYPHLCGEFSHKSRECDRLTDNLCLKFSSHRQSLPQTSLRQAIFVNSR